MKTNIKKTVIPKPKPKPQPKPMNEIVVYFN